MLFPLNSAVVREPSNWMVLSESVVLDEAFAMNAPTPAPEFAAVWEAASPPAPVVLSKDIQAMTVVPAMPARSLPVLSDPFVVTSAAMTAPL